MDIDRYIGWFSSQLWYVKAVILVVAIVAIIVLGSLCEFVHDKWRRRGDQGGIMRFATNRLKEAVAGSLIKVIVVLVAAVCLFLCWRTARRDQRSQSARAQEGR